MRVDAMNWLNYAPVRSCAMLCAECAACAACICWAAPPLYIHQAPHWYCRHHDPAGLNKEESLRNSLCLFCPALDCRARRALCPPALLAAASVSCALGPHGSLDPIAPGALGRASPRTASRKPCVRHCCARCWPALDTGVDSSCVAVLLQRYAAFFARAASRLRDASSWRRFRAIISPITWVRKLHRHTSMTKRRGTSTTPATKLPRLSKYG